MLGSKIIKPSFHSVARELEDKGEIFSMVYVGLRGGDVEVSFEGVARRAEVRVGLSPVLTRSIEIKVRSGDRECEIYLSHEIVEMIEEALRGFDYGTR